MAEANQPLPEFVHVSAPGYGNAHVEGFHATVYAFADAFAKPGPRHEAVNVLPGVISPADLRHLKRLFHDFGLEPIVLPDYSATLDGPVWDEYRAFRRIERLSRPFAAWAASSHDRVRLDLGPRADRRGAVGATFRCAAVRVAAADRRYANRPLDRGARPVDWTAHARGL